MHKPCPAGAPAARVICPAGFPGRVVALQAGMAQPPFAHLARTIRERVAAQGFMQLMGADLSALEPGGATISVARRPDLLQQHGFFHGGVTAFLVDNGTTIAAATRLREGQACLTAEYKLNLLAPARGERLVCRARVVRAGRRMSVVAADVFSVQDGRETQTAIALATIAVVDADGLPPAGSRPGEVPEDMDPDRPGP